MTHEPVIVADITCLPPPCMSKERALQIYTEPFRRVVEYTNLCHVEGDITEFGTFHGFTARMFTELMKEYGDKRTLLLYDSWQGFPATVGEIDSNCKEVKEGYWKQGDCNPALGIETEVRIASILDSILPGQIKTCRGFYQDTVKPEYLPKSISILHIDCDLYESTLLVLEKVRPLLSEGAVILFDDFNNNLASNNYGERAAFRNSSIAAYCEPWFTYGWSGYAFIYHKVF